MNNHHYDKAKVKGIRKPSFMVFTDKDGTLNLKDKQLSNIIALITAMGGMIVPTTGRTVGDIEEDFEKRKIMLPKLIIGDNGANVYSTVHQEFIMKKTLEQEKVKKVLDHYRKIGGNPDLIRYTDGKHIYASQEKNVKKYYQHSQMAKLFEDMEETTETSKEITKITLAGKKELMEEMAEYVQNIGFWTDMDKTKFPRREDENYRLDIAQKNINKGEAVKAIVKYFKPQYGYMCVGNGYNDISMFEQALRDGMIAAIMEESDPKLIKQMQNYAKEVGRGRVLIVPRDKNKANRLIYKQAKIFQAYMKSQDFHKREKQRLPNVQRIKIKSTDLKGQKRSQNRSRRKGHIER